jgi:acetoin utilization deacetylase AcuC-like enzyme
LPPGCGDAEYVGLVRRILVPVALAFRPELILVSCGFDAHRDDPLASMRVSRAGYAEMTRSLRAVAEEVCGGRVAFVLEGGYAESGLYEGTSAVLDASLDAAPPVLAPAPEAPPGSTLADVIRQLRTVHGGRFEGLGAA